jgi:hypothetical protein
MAEKWCCTPETNTKRSRYVARLCRWGVAAGPVSVAATPRAAIAISKEKTASLRQSAGASYK